MGCFSGNCAVSHFGIAYGEKCLKIVPGGVYEETPYASVSYTYDIMQDLLSRQRHIELYESRMNEHEEGSDFYIASNIMLDSAKKESLFSYVGYGDYDDYGRIENAEFEVGEDIDTDNHFFIKEEVIKTILGRSLTEETFYDDMYKIAAWCMWNRIQLCQTTLLGSQDALDDSFDKRQQYIDMQQRLLNQQKLELEERNKEFEDEVVH